MGKCIRITRKKRKKTIGIIERKVGEIFEYNGEWYQCMEGTGCYRCAFNYDGDTCIVDNPCCSTCRNDKKDVIFKKLEKDGVPFSCNYYGDNRLIMMQEYKLYNLYDVANEDKIPMYITDYKHKRIAIEIKQNKEDMEEREYSEEDMKNNPRFKHHKNIEQVINMQKMKPFDLEAAKAGKPVCTRDGRKARIICFDLNNKNFPIVAIINCDTEENAYQYDIDGVCDEHDNNLNLMMIPKKKEGWIIIHKEAIYDKETAEKIAKETTADVIRIQKIEWEE